MHSSESTKVKVLAVCALLAVGVVIVLLNAPKVSANSDQQSVQIVARANLLNQTGGTPLLTLFTPPATGLYRVSVYGVTTVSDSGGNASVDIDLFWTDVAKAQIASMGSVSLNTQGATSSDSIIINAIGGKPVSFLLQVGTVQGSPMYCMFFSAERL
jgi:hypothetical protein